MHTILTDFGRSTMEITDAEWDIRMVDANRQRYWTYASEWHDHLAGHERLLNDHLALKRTKLACRPLSVASEERFIIANQTHECGLRVCQSVLT